MTLRRGDIVRVDLGGPDDDDTRGSELYKSRRAVVIQNDTGNEFAPTTIVAPLSKGHTEYPFHRLARRMSRGLTPWSKPT